MCALILNDLKDKLSGKYGHDIKYMLKYLNYRYFSLPELKCLNGSCVPSYEYNQVWRYGIEVDLQIQKLIEKELCKIAEWLRGIIT